MDENKTPEINENDKDLKPEEALDKQDTPEIEEEMLEIEKDTPESKEDTPINKDEKPVGQDINEEAKPPKARVHEFIYEFVSVMISSVIIIAFIFTFLFRLVGVNGSSMKYTLESGDWLIVQTFFTKLDYKDIVIVTQENLLHETLIKRVIAVGGQKIDIDFDQGIVYIDDEPLIEKYTATPTEYKSYDLIDLPLTVPEGYLFVMGDNRNNSTDSRSKKVGLIQEENILGKAVGRVLPFKNGWDIYSNSQ